MKYFLMLLLLMPSEVFAGEDSFKGKDKPLHFGVSAIVGFSARTFYPNDPWKAVGVTMAAGTLKEVIDPKFSGKDLVVDFAGALVGVYVGGCYITHNSVICGWKF